MMKQKMFAVFLFFVCLAFTTTSFSAQKEGDKTGQKEVSQEVKEALDAVKNDSAEQRDEAVKKGFLDSYDSLSKAFDKAVKEF